MTSWPGRQFAASTSMAARNWASSDAASRRVKSGSVTPASLVASRSLVKETPQRVDSVRKTSFRRGNGAVELPGLATALQLFVLGVVIRMWDALAAAEAAGG